MERIVRPFREVGVTPPLRIGQATPAAPEIVRITPGIVGSTKTFSGSFSGNHTTYMGQRNQEKSFEE